MNGLTDTGVTAAVHGVFYRLPALPVGEIPARDEIRRVYAALYRSHMPASEYRRNMLIDG